MITALAATAASITSFFAVVYGASLYARGKGHSVHHHDV